MWKKHKVKIFSVIGLFFLAILDALLAELDILQLLSSMFSQIGSTLTVVVKFLLSILMIGVPVWFIILVAGLLRIVLYFSSKPKPQNTNLERKERTTLPYKEWLLTWKENYRNEITQVVPICHCKCELEPPSSYDVNFQHRLTCPACKNTYPIFTTLDVSAATKVVVHTLKHVDRYEED